MRFKTIILNYFFYLKIFLSRLSDDQKLKKIVKKSKYVFGDKQFEKYAIKNYYLNQKSPSDFFNLGFRHSDIIIAKYKLFSEILKISEGLEFLKKKKYFLKLKKKYFNFDEINIVSETTSNISHSVLLAIFLNIFDIKSNLYYTPLYRRNYRFTDEESFVVSRELRKINKKFSNINIKNLDDISYNLKLSKEIKEKIKITSCIDICAKQQVITFLNNKKYKDYSHLINENLKSKLKFRYLQNLNNFKKLFFITTKNKSIWINFNALVSVYGMLSLVLKEKKINFVGYEFFGISEKKIFISQNRPPHFVDTQSIISYYLKNKDNQSLLEKYSKILNNRFDQNLIIFP